MSAIDTTDFDSAVMFVDGKVVQRGGQATMQNFAFSTTEGKALVAELYAYEKCCSNDGGGPSSQNPLFVRLGLCGAHS